MVLTYKEGWLYFLGEKDFKTEETFSYVKIGKTNNDRPVSKRKNDHQTGNPRHIVEVSESIRTNFINALETHMHNRFATKRVSGEWFELDKKGIKNVVSEAKKVNALLDTVLTEGQAIKKIKESESNGNIISANKSIKANYQNYLSYKKKNVHYSLKKEIIRYKISELTVLHGGVKGVFEQYIPSKAIFDEEGFKKKHPALYKKYRKVEYPVTGRCIIIKGPTQANSYEKLYSKLKILKSKSKNPTKFRDKEIDRDSKLEALHQEWLELTEKEAQAKLHSEIFHLKLQHACKFNEKIENVCTWKRVSKEKISLDKKSLKKDKEKIYQKYMVPQSQTPTRRMIRGRPYSFE